CFLTLAPYVSGCTKCIFCRLAFEFTGERVCLSESSIHLFKAVGVSDGIAPGVESFHDRACLWSIAVSVILANGDVKDVLEQVAHRIRHSGAGAVGGRHYCATLRPFCRPGHVGCLILASVTAAVRDVAVSANHLRMWAVARIKREAESVLDVNGPDVSVDSVVCRPLAF